jgi:hypothetical protein
MRHHGSGMGRGRMNPDRVDDCDPTPRRGGMGFGLGHHGIQHHGRRINRPSTAERIEYLEEFQRDLEEMTEDVGSQLSWLKQRESERA